MRGFTFALCLVVLAGSTVSANRAFQLPGGSGRPADASFSCEGREYGYYADVSNQCKVYHICQPQIDEFGQAAPAAHYSFVCGQDAVFSQLQLACVHRGTLEAPCQEAPNLYESVNAQFRLEELQRQEAKDAARTAQAIQI
ncbi:unnamed protein product [Meganyctiphanes norvegica]|uniref:Chitin-binding type-2 domain-containing protein n=1 Tax=Meganyctiphanes norvegica TaxID=48144 RepID=A0AAV2SE24_MEGNR